MTTEFLLRGKSRKSWRLSKGWDPVQIIYPARIWPQVWSPALTFPLLKKKSTSGRRDWKTLEWLSTRGSPKDGTQRWQLHTPCAALSLTVESTLHHSLVINEKCVCYSSMSHPGRIIKSKKEVGILSIACSSQTQVAKSFLATCVWGRSRLVRLSPHTPGPDNTVRYSVITGMELEVM